MRRIPTHLRATSWTVWTARALEAVGWGLVCVMAMMLWVQVTEVSVDWSEFDGKPQDVARMFGDASIVACDAGFANLEMFVAGVRTSEATVDVLPKLCIPRSTLLALRDREGGRVFARSGAGLKLLPGHEHGGLNLLISGPTSESIDRIRYTEVKIASEARDGVVTLPRRTMPLVGGAQAYPLDEYYTELLADLTSVDGTYFLWERKHVVGLGGAVLVDFTSLYSLTGVHLEQDDGALHVRRPRATLIFVGAMLVVPLLLMAALSLATQLRKDGGSLEFVLGGSAVLLALLPIRVVLVPEDVSGLTLVDYVLAVEVSLLAALCLRALRKAATSRALTSGGGRGRGRTVVIVQQPYLPSRRRRR